MSWSAQSHVTTGDLISAAFINQNVDNATWLGNNHDHLTSVGAGDGAALGFDICVVRNSAVQSVPSATPTTLTYDTEVLDVNNWHSTSANQGRITVTKAGKYLVWGNFSAATGSGLINIDIVTNASVSNIARFYGDLLADTSVGATICGFAVLAISDYVSAIALHTDAGNIDIATNAAWAFGLVRLTA